MDEQSSWARSSNQQNPFFQQWRQPDRGPEQNYDSPLSNSGHYFHDHLSRYHGNASSNTNTDNEWDPTHSGNVNYTSISSETNRGRIHEQYSNDNQGADLESDGRSNAWTHRLHPMWGYAFAGYTDHYRQGAEEVSGQTEESDITDDGLLTEPGYQTGDEAPDLTDFLTEDDTLSRDTLTGDIGDDLPDDDDFSTTAEHGVIKNDIDVSAVRRRLFAGDEDTHVGPSQRCSDNNWRDAQQWPAAKRHKRKCSELRLTTENQDSEDDEVSMKLSNRSYL